MRILKVSWRIGLQWSPISIESAIMLEQSFTKDEVSKAVIHSNKASSWSESFTVAVFKDWEVVKEDLPRLGVKWSIWA